MENIQRDRTLVDVLEEHHKYIQKHETKSKEFNKRMVGLFDYQVEMNDRFILSNEENQRIAVNTEKQIKKDKKKNTLHFCLLYGIVIIEVVTRFI